MNPATIRANPRQRSILDPAQQVVCGKTAGQTVGIGADLLPGVLRSVSPAEVGTILLRFRRERRCDALPVGHGACLSRMLPSLLKTYQGEVCERSRRQLLATVINGLALTCGPVGRLVRRHEPGHEPGCCAKPRTARRDDANGPLLIERHLDRITKQAIHHQVRKTHHVSDGLNGGALNAARGILHLDEGCYALFCCNSFFSKKSLICRSYLSSWSCATLRKP